MWAAQLAEMSDTAQLAEMRGKYEKARDKQKSLRAHIGQLEEKEQELYDEMDRFKELITDLENLQQDLLQLRPAEAETRGDVLS